MKNTQAIVPNLDERDPYDSYYECITSCSWFGGEDIECISQCMKVHLKIEDEKEIN